MVIPSGPNFAAICLIKPLLPLLRKNNCGQWNLAEMGTKFVQTLLPEGFRVFRQNYNSNLSFSVVITIGVSVIRPIFCRNR